MTKYMKFITIILAVLLLLPAAFAYDVDVNTYSVLDGDGFLSDNTIVTVTGTDLENLTIGVTDEVDIVYFEDLSTGDELSVTLSTLSSSFSSSDLLTLGYSFTEGTDLETGTVDIMSDFVTPVFSWTSAQDTVSSSDTPTIYFEITDDQSTSFVCDIYLNSELLLADQSYGTGSEFETFATSIADGDHEVYFECVDEALNQNLENVLSFSVDTEVPVVSLENADEGTTNDNTFLVEFIPEDNLADELTCGLFVGEVGDDLELEESDSYTNGELVTTEITGLIIEGEFQYLVVCTDDAGNEGVSTTQTFSVVDATVPVITVSSPSESEVFDLSSSSVVIISSTIVDDFSAAAGLTVTLTRTDPDGTTQIAPASNPSGDLFGETISFDGSSDDGWYVITIDATDEAGNSATETINIAFDNAAPEFTTVTAPASVSSYDDISFSFEATDTVDTELTCNLNLDDTTMVYGVGGVFSFTAESETIDTETTLTVSEDEWDTVIGMDPVAGDHNFYITCTDDVSLTGTSETQTVEFIDSDPVIVISSPVEFESFGEAYVDGTSTIEITYGITDFIGTSLSSLEFYVRPELESVLSDFPNESADGTYSYTFDATGYADQYIFITAGAFDDSGNEGYAESTFYIDTAPSTATVTDAPTIVAAGSEDITVEVDSEAGFYSVYVMDGDGNIVGETTTTEAAASSVTVSVDFSSFSNEEETFIVYTIDDAGNSGAGDDSLSDEFTVYIDATAPTISSFTCSDLTVGASSDCTCDATDDSSSVSYGSTVTAVVTGDDTSAAGTITAICTATDSQGNVADLSEVDFTVSAAVSASGSSGGGGGGGSSSSRTECNDNRDNDGDGLFDEDDPGCSSTSDDSEEDEVCKESWICLAWSICSASEQSRSCYDANGCSTKIARGQADVLEESPMPAESRSCEEEVSTIEVEETVEEPVVEVIESEDTGFASGITGAVTGFFGGSIKDLLKPLAVLVSLALLTGLGLLLKKKFTK